MAKQITYGDAILLIDEDQLSATAPATGKGFSDLVMISALSYQHWKTGTEGLDVTDD